MRALIEGLGPGNRLDQTGKARCLTGSFRAVSSPAAATGRPGNCGADSGRRIPSCGRCREVDEQVLYIHCGRCTEGGAQPRRQIDIMVKRVPSMVIRANSRVEQYRY